MSFLEQSVTLNTTDTILYTCPATLDGSAHGLVFSNITEVAASVALKLYNKASGLTTTVAAAFEIAANTPVAWPKPINMAAGDQIIASASVASAIVAVASIYTNSSTPAATGFTPRGEWSSVANYNPNDLVSLNGSSYIAINANTNSQPSTASTDWMTGASKGDTGASGYTLPVATSSVLGGVKQGNNVTIAGDGTLSTPDPYVLPVATPTTLGGVKQGSNITIGADGTISGDTPYTLPVATAATLGGVKQGTNTSIAADGTISVSGLATVATSGAYGDLTGKPALATVATSGSYGDLTGKPSLGSIASQNAASVAVTGGTIDGVTIGATTAAPATFTSATINGKTHTKALSVAITALGSVSGTVNLDCSAANAYSLTPTAATTLNPTNPPAAGRNQVVVLQITNGGAQTITYPTGSKFAGGTAPTLTSSGTDWLGMAYDPVAGSWVVFILGINVK